MEDNNPSEISPLTNEYEARYASSTSLFNTGNGRSVPPELWDHYTMSNQLNPSELQYDCNYYGKDSACYNEKNERIVLSSV